MTVRAARRVAVLVALCAGLAGCSFQFGGTSVSQSDLEQVVSDKLTPTLGRRPDTVQCPDELAGEVGATTRCTLSMPDARYRVDIKVTSVEDSTVNFDIEMDEQPIGA